MIRNPIKIGIIQATDGGVEHLPIPVGHNGTISQIIFMCYKNGSLVDPSDALASFTLDATSQAEGNFTILNQLSPEFLKYRMNRHRMPWMVPVGGILHYDPAAGMYKDEFTRNKQTLGCADLSALTIRADFLADTTTLDRIEVWVDLDYNLIQPIGEHVRISSLTDFVPAAGGKIEITELPVMDRRYGFHALHIGNSNPGSTNRLMVDKVSVVINGQRHAYRDVPTGVVEYLAMLQGRRQEVTVANKLFATVDFNKEDLASYFLPAGMNEFKVIPEYVATGTPVGASVQVFYELIRKVR